MPPPTPARTRAALLGAGSALASAAFTALAVASARRATVGPDEQLHGGMRVQMDDDTDAATAAVAPALDAAGLWWIYAPAALAAALAVLASPKRTAQNRRGRRLGAVVIASIPALVGALSPAMDRWIPQPSVGPRRRPVDHPVFPSGHAFRASAVSLAAAYVVTREELVPPTSAWPVAVAAPVVVGFSRLAREKHLASDVLGGWLAGLALAAAALAAYELARHDGATPADAVRSGPSTRRPSPDRPGAESRACPVPHATVRSATPPPTLTP